MSWDEKAFAEKLEANHEFPDEYMFKFIVKPEHQQEVEALLPQAVVKVKPSSGNKYVSISLTQKMKSSQEVVDIYQQAYKIEGIIAL